MKKNVDKAGGWDNDSMTNEVHNWCAIEGFYVLYFCDDQNNCGL